MKLLLWVFGWPHEALHVLALRLLGRRPEATTSSHVDIPGDLSTGEYVFVAGLPGLIFWGATAVCAQVIFDAANILQALLGLLLTLVCGLAAIGTLGDLHLIIVRLLESRDVE